MKIIILTERGRLIYIRIEEAFIRLLTKIAISLLAIIIYLRTRYVSAVLT